MSPSELDGLCMACVAKMGFSEAEIGIDPRPDDGPVKSEVPRKIRYFGDYEIRSEVARGGMGVVYRARQMTLNRDVALKMVMGGVLASETEVQRFRTEAEAAARLDHPNIVAIYEFGEHEGCQYFTMKFIEGGSLAQRIGEYTGHQRAAAVLMAKVARAIHYAHQHGVLHRDVKPANILLDEYGDPHVTDFGLAKIVEDERNLTLSGAVMGSPAYMAPEQAEGSSKRISAGTDVYGLGAVLYHLLTGSPPFKGKSAMQVVAKVIDSAPALPSSLMPKLDEQLESICLRCLEKNPASRYSSAAGLADDLERWLQGEHRESSRAPFAARLRNRIRRNPVVAGCLAVAVLALGMVGWKYLPTGGWLGKRGEILKAGGMAPSKQVSPFVGTNAQLRARWTNSLGMVFVPVPGTEVQFCIWETRFQDHGTFAKQTSRAVKLPSLEGPTYPAVNVSWGEAKEFCQWLTEKEQKAGLLASDQLYRLPTDEEWSRAVGLTSESGSTPVMRMAAGIKGVYPWGTGWPPPRGAGNYAESLNMDDFERTAPVGSFDGNAYGIHDLSGNVWEWCEDSPGDSGRNRRVLRGGSWNCDRPADLLSSGRFIKEVPSTPYDHIGFRVVLAIFDSELERNLRRTSQSAVEDGSVRAIVPGGLASCRQLLKKQGGDENKLYVHGGILCYDEIDGLNLDPLKGVPLNSLHFVGSPTADLKPVVGMPLYNLNLHSSPNLTDLSPIRALQLRKLTLDGCTSIRDFSVLSELNLESLDLKGTAIADISIVIGKNLKYLRLEECRQIKSLLPLKGHNSIETLIVPMNAPDMEALRGLPKLKMIGFTEEGLKAPKDFWAEYDSKKKDR